MKSTATSLTGSNVGRMLITDGPLTRFTASFLRMDLRAYCTYFVAVRILGGPMYG